MIQKIIRQVFTLQYNYEHPIDQERAQGLLRVIWSILGLWFIVMLPTMTESGFTIARISSLLLAPLVLLVNIYLIQTGRMKEAALLFVLSLFPFPLALVIRLGIDSSAIVALLVPITGAGLLLTRRWFVLTSFLITMTIALFILGSETVVNMGEMLSPFVAILMIFTLFYVFSGNVNKLARRTIREMGQYRLVGHFAWSNYVDEMSIYRSVLNIILQELDYDFAQIFIVGDTGQITQRVRLGFEPKDDLIVTSIQLGDASLLLEVSRSMKATQISFAESELRRTHFVSAMNYGLAVPIVFRGHTVAVLDVQDATRVFSDNNVDVLTHLGSMIAAAIGNIRILKDLRESFQDNQEVVTNLRSQLSEYRQTQREVVGSSWDTYLEQRGQEAIGFDLDAQDKRIISAHNLSPQLREAIKAGDVHIEPTLNGQIVSVPIMLADEVLGAMSFSIPADRVITSRSLDLAKNVASRLALALENKRLYEQSQSQATRERRANQVAETLLSATDVDTVLSLAANSFNDVLGAVSTRIHLQPDILMTQEFAAMSDGSTEGRHNENRK